MADRLPGEVQQFQALAGIGTTMGFSTLIEAEKMANLALGMAIEFTSSSRGYLQLLSPQGRTRYTFGIDLARRTSDHRPPADVAARLAATRASRDAARGLSGPEGRPYLCVPMVMEGDLVGVLYLDRPVGARPFEDREERLAAMAASQLGISITARLLYEQMLEKRKQVELIDKISKAVNSPVELDKVLALVVETAAQALRADGAALLLQDEAGRWKVRCADRLPADLLESGAHPLAARLVAEAQAAEATRIHPAPGMPPGAGEPGRAVAVPVKLTLRDKRIFNERRRSIYSVPFLKVLGVLYLEGRGAGEEFTEDDQFVLQVFADHITTAVTNDALYQQASTDTLTGLASRRYLDSRLHDEIDFARRTGLALSVVLIDLDDFKWLNDTYGHQAGDEILRQVGQVLRRSIRKFDICGRYGGEEFILALPETDTPGAQVVAENVRERIASEAFLDPDSPVLVTVSLGVATFPHHARSLHDLVGASDAALYQAKRAGKNRHAVADRRSAG